MFGWKKRGDKDFIADYLNNFEKRRLFLNRIKIYIILFLFISYIYLLYDKLNRKLDELMVETQVSEVPCYIHVKMAKDSLHIYYGNIIDSIKSTPQKKKSNKFDRN